MSEEFPVDSHGKIIVFGAKQIRRIWHDEQWFFSVVDIIGNRVVDTLSTTEINRR